MKHVALITASIEQNTENQFTLIVLEPEPRLQFAMLCESEDEAIRQVRQILAASLSAPTPPAQALKDFAASLSKLGDESVVPQEPAAAPIDTVRDVTDDNEAGTPQ